MKQRWLVTLRHKDGEAEEHEVEALTREGALVVVYGQRPIEKPGYRVTVKKMRVRSTDQITRGDSMNRNGWTVKVREGL